jgi:hypothetical protein
MDLLTDCLSDFEVCARRAVECILRSPTRMIRLFRDSGRNLHGTLVRCSVKMGNEAYRIRISLSLKQEDLPALARWISDQEMRFDVVGEIVNTVAGNFLGRKSFVSRFGAASPSLPFFENGVKMEDEAQSIEGVMQINSVNIHFELTAARNREAA